MTTITTELRRISSTHRKKMNERFFKTQEGEYGYGDIFIGVSKPDQNILAKKYFKNMSLDEVQELVCSRVHEHRMCGFLILINKYKYGNDKDKQMIYRYIMKYKKQLNNWDLVDCVVPHTIGDVVMHNKIEKKKVLALYASHSMWDRRISILSLFPSIKSGNIQDICILSKKLFKDKEDLIHKALGWMLREAYKKDNVTIEKFIQKNYNAIPRTTLRYAIERMPISTRKKYLQGKFT